MADIAKPSKNTWEHVSRGVNGKFPAPALPAEFLPRVVVCRGNTAVTPAHSPHAVNINRFDTEPPQKRLGRSDVACVGRHLDDAGANSESDVQRPTYALEGLFETSARFRDRIMHLSV